MKTSVHRGPLTGPHRPVPLGGFLEVREPVFFGHGRPSVMILAMTKGKTTPRPAAIPPSISPEEGISLLNELIERGNALMRRGPTKADMDAYIVALNTGLEEAFGSESDLTHSTMLAGVTRSGWDEHYDPVSSWNEELHAKTTLLAECIAQLKRIEARHKTTAPASPTVPASLATVEKILKRFHKVVVQLRTRRDTRPPLKMEDEYDVQYLLHALLLVSFDDVRPEETGPSVAGARPRVDFLLKAEQIVIEVKKTRESLSTKDLANELFADIARYQAHPDCATLICFIYDPDGRVSNVSGFTSDIQMTASKMPVRVHVVPAH